MSKPSLVIDHAVGIQRAALIDRQNRLQRFWATPIAANTLQAGAIVRGRVGQRFPQLKSALLTVPGYGEVQLKGRDVPPASQDDEIAVQITAEGQRSQYAGIPVKHPRGSLALSWPSRGLIYLPQGPSRIQCSKRASDFDVSTVEKVLSAMPGQWIIRQAASEMAPDQIIATAQALYQQAKDEELADIPGHTAVMAALLEAPIPYDKLVMIADDGEAEQAIEMACARLGLPAPNIDQRPGLFTDLDLDQRLDALLAPVVHGEGFRLVIEPTEAFISIDVDLAKAAAIDAAMAACWDDIVLRNLSGLIIIDLPRQGDWEIVAMRFKDLTMTHHERVAVDVLPGPGLVSLSIPRRRPMLHEVWRSTQKKA